MDELKPCPFCGSTDLRMYIFEEDDHDVYIKCIECFGQINARGRENAIAAWNRRVGTDISDDDYEPITHFFQD